jgi:sec-independent protein translocase protein TatA
LDFLGIGAMEVLFILLIAFLLFGPRRLPEIARAAGKAVREFRKYSSALTGDLKAEFDKGLNAAIDTPPNKPQATPQTTGETLNSPDITPQKTEEVKPPNPNE